MEIFKIVAIGLVGAFCYVFLLSTKSEIAPLVLLATGIVLIIEVVNYLFISISFFKDLASIGEISGSLLTTVLKIMAISYVLEFATSLCTDLNVKSIETKLAFAGKLIIFVISLPIYKELFNVITSFIS
ncbi:MAG: hypothetical protein IKV61_05550 [Clostridia bacterium]|nr:hypothetical protein [Clostridia bacterium]